MSTKIKNPKKYLLLGALALVVAILTWLIINLVTMNTTLKVVVDYKLTEGNDIRQLSDIDYGDYAVGIDGEIVDSKGTEGTLPTASTAKMILALAVMHEKPFELGETGETITINDDYYERYGWYLNNNGSNTPVAIGEEISQYDALASTLMASSNNMADTLAIWAFGSLDNYREYATSMLHELGINDTTIGPDASGYNEGTTSTASDLARIGYFVMKNPVLREIVGTKEREVPVAGVLNNTNRLLGVSNISGIKTGYIGDVSGYCLISGYDTGGHIVTVALLGAPSRNQSFEDSLTIVQKIQELTPLSRAFEENQSVGHLETWWQEDIPIVARESLDILNWNTPNKNTTMEFADKSGTLSLQIGENHYSVEVGTEEYQKSPSLIQKIMHIFGWKYTNQSNGSEENSAPESGSNEDASTNNSDRSDEVTPGDTSSDESSQNNETAELYPITDAYSDNYTIKFGYLMLINPNFRVDTDFISARRNELVSISELYGIVEGNPYNGDNLLDPVAGEHINDMVKAYEADYPGHTLETRSCFRARGTTCGRLCTETGASDHHTGLTCDLLDPAYGTSLDTDTYDQHIDWQWLRANSYKYGFIDRFPYEWAGGPMSEPLNVDEYGSTGLFETWHYRYVGIKEATEIATGKYNNGEYDSLEHYLKARGLISDLKNGN